MIWIPCSYSGYDTYVNKHFRYLKWRNADLYNGLFKGKPNPKIAENKVQEKPSILGTWNSWWLWSYLHTDLQRFQPMLGFGASSIGDVLFLPAFQLKRLPSSRKGPDLFCENIIHVLKSAIGSKSGLTSKNSKKQMMFQCFFLRTLKKQTTKNDFAPNPTKGPLSRGSIWRKHVDFFLVFCQDFKLHNFFGVVWNPTARWERNTLSCRRWRGKRCQSDPLIPQIKVTNFSPEKVT